MKWGIGGERGLLDYFRRGKLTQTSLFLKRFRSKQLNQASPSLMEILHPPPFSYQCLLERGGGGEQPTHLVSWEALPSSAAEASPD